MDKLSVIGLVVLLPSCFFYRQHALFLEVLEFLARGAMRELLVAQVPRGT